MGGASKLLMLLSTPFPLLYPRPAALRLARPSRFSLSRFSTASPSSFSFPFTPIPSPDSAPRPQAADPANSPYIARESWDLPASFTPRPTHPWPEWSRLVDHLTAGGYSSRQIRHAGVEDDDSFAVYEELPGEFVRAAEMCLSFARAQPDALRLLSKKDIEVVVENGSPSLFKNGENSVRRMRSFVSGQTVWESEKAETVDIMRYLLSHVCHPLLTSVKNSVIASEPTEASARNLLNELVNVIGNVRQTNFTVPTPRQTPLTQEQFSRPPGQNIEMKKGDWICQKCSFMNFARNVRCRECDEGRPKRELTGGEWECPQCDFFNFRRNVSCMRCDCKRPGEAPAPVTDSGYGRKPSFEQTFDRHNMDESEIKRKLAANDEKAERWFSKVGQLDDASNLSRDEDFPEIMPLRKGVNKFVVSTRKTPLERRLANSQYGSNSANDGATDRNTESSINESLDRILGRSSSSSGATNKDSRQGDPDHVPFVPLPADMFSKSTTPDSDMGQSSPKPSQSTNSASTISETPMRTKIDNESADASERWSKTVAELDDVTNMANAISDEDFPEIMPMRKGENRFVVSKKKDRSLTSPQYKRRLAMEQANSSNFVPFVPFPPDYFAKKDKKPEAMAGDSIPGEQVHRVAEKPEETKTVDYNPQSPEPDSRMVSNDGQTGGTYSGYNARPSQQGQALQSYRSGYNAPQPSQQGQALQGESQKHSGTSLEGSVGNAPRPSQQGQALQSYGESWKYSGTSLEGSAVKETDPLDMSEEAKAERWFRRAAQIKDIDELSKIPDEDFPEIMPMRKGVNRFVVSKRKTPLERRLTSPQYRRNLPTVSSDPEKDGK